MTQEDRNAWETEQARALTEASETIAKQRAEITRLTNATRTPLEDAAKQIQAITGSAFVKIDRNHSVQTSYCGGVVHEVEYVGFWYTAGHKGMHRDTARSLSALVEVARTNHEAATAKDDHPELSAV